MTYKAYSQIHPAIQFLILISVFVGVLIIGNLIGAGIVLGLYGLKTFMAIVDLNVSAPHFTSALWVLQITGTTLPILLAPVIFWLAVMKKNGEYLRLSFRFPWVLMLIILAAMFISNPLIEFLSNINQKMVLPEYLKWMRASEDKAQKLTEALLQMNNIGDMMVNLLLVGLLTAIVEELMFRGCMQTIFLQWTKNTHAAVWITAILFSAFHMEFFGFLPRLLLGVLFGYFVAWSGSVWTGVWAHFINNGTAVAATYLYQKKIIKVNPDEQHLYNYAAYVFSFLILLFLLYIFRLIVNKQQVREG